MLKVPSEKLSTFRVIGEAIHAYPAVKFAFGTAAVLGAVGLVYYFGVGVKLAILSLIPSMALLAALWLFAHARHHAPIDFELPANVFVQMSLVVFTIVTILLFATLLFGIPYTLNKIGSVTSFVFPPNDTEQPVLLVDADSGWVPARPKLGEVCASKRAIYEERYPSYNIDVVISSDHTSEGQQSFYRYHCRFTATPR